MKPVAIVFTGEVDSGKSTLIGRLLYDTKSISSQAITEFRNTCCRLERGLEFAYLLDSLEEERRDEFTLDTTQSVLKNKGKEFILIDVPGHRELMRNMLTGASYADAAVLMVDVKKSLEEQTKRHLYILNFLGIGQVILVVNKMDAVSYNKEDFAQCSSQVAAFLKEIGLKCSYVIPISAQHGDNLLTKSGRMDWYNGPSLLMSLRGFTKKDDIYDFRFPVQDMYDVKGEKVIVGMLSSGKIRRGDLAMVCLSGAKIRVKGIRAFRKIKFAACANESIGLVFYGAQGLKRGDVIYKGRAPKVADSIQAKIFCLNRIDIRDVLSIKCATQETACSIASIKTSMDTATLDIHRNAKFLDEFYAAEVTLQTNAPLAMEKFADLPALGRFTLDKEGQVCAAGIIC